MILKGFKILYPVLFKAVWLKEKKMRKKNYQPSNFFDYLERGVCVSLGKGRALEVPGSMALKVGAPEPGCFFPHASTTQLDGKGHPGFLKGDTCCRLALSRPAVHTSLPLLPRGGTHLPGLSRSPPAGHWQHMRMYSCRAC